jgi:hypothetical protein
VRKGIGFGLVQLTAVVSMLLVDSMIAINSFGLDPFPTFALFDLSFGTDLLVFKNETGASQPFIQFSKILKSSPQFLTAA